MQHRPHLDSLRAVAITLVLVEHWGGAPGRAWLPIGGGDLGVNLFFVLSGFLITSILLEALDREPATPGAVLGRFYLRRLCRLAPVFYATILALALLDINGMGQAWPWHAAYLSNVHAALGHEKTVFWSLAVEEQFYLLWPLLLAWSPPRHRLVAALCLVATGLCWKLTAWWLGLATLTANMLLFGNLETLGLGCVLAVLSYRRRASCDFGWHRGAAALGLAWLACSALALAVLLWALAGRVHPVRFIANDLLTGLFFAWLVLHGARGFTGLAGRLAASAPVQHLGRLSYGVYVVHTYPSDVLEAYLGPMPKPLMAPVVVALTFGLCALSWRWLEQPLRRLGYRLAEPGKRFALSTTGGAVVPNSRTGPA